MNVETKEIILKPENNNRLISLCGPSDDNLKKLENQLKIIINRRDNLFKLTGCAFSINIAAQALVSLYSETKPTYGIINDINPEQVYLTIKCIQSLLHQSKMLPIFSKCSMPLIKIELNYKTIKPRTVNQSKYINNIFNNKITFGIGPAGTGKTFLAIAVAIDLLERKKIQHIILSRPAIEAGEKLGFLPGDHNQKTDPYMRPLYDLLYSILGYKRMEQLMQKNIIEVIPLAYMRGRTLNNAVIILDESQNTTITQMKMFLTRIGFNSTMIITGDITQIDLPSQRASGLAHAVKILSSIQDISFNFFTKEDIVRHTIITHIIDAYDTWHHNTKHIV